LFPAISARHPPTHVHRADLHFGMDLQNLRSVRLTTNSHRHSPHELDSSRSTSPLQKDKYLSPLVTSSVDGTPETQSHGLMTSTRWSRSTPITAARRSATSPVDESSARNRDYHSSPSPLSHVLQRPRPGHPSRYSWCSTVNEVIELPSDSPEISVAPPFCERWVYGKTFAGVLAPPSIKRAPALLWIANIFEVKKE
jgi:hypothetical protein